MGQDTDSSVKKKQRLCMEAKQSKNIYSLFSIDRWCPGKQGLSTSSDFFGSLNNKSLPRSLTSASLPRPTSYSMKYPLWLVWVSCPGYVCSQTFAHLQPTGHQTEYKWTALMLCEPCSARPKHWCSINACKYKKQLLPGKLTPIQPDPFTVLICESSVTHMQSKSHLPPFHPCIIRESWQLAMLATLHCAFLPKPRE